MHSPVDSRRLFRSGAPPRKFMNAAGMYRFAVVLCALLCCLNPAAAQSPLSVADLDSVDRATLAATLDGNVLQLEPYLAADFQAHIQVPTDQGPQTLVFNREEFLLYAWQARSAADGYRVRSQQPARYVIAADGRSATGTRILDESLNWNGQALRYTTQRTTHYRPLDGRILVTRLDVRVVDWDPPGTAK